MNFFQLDPPSIAARVHASNRPPRIPTFAQSVLRGAVGFMIVSMAGFLPWVFAGKWSHQHPSELAIVTLTGQAITTFMKLLLWGACFGISFGAGLGIAFYLCQARTRALLR